MEAEVEVDESPGRARRAVRSMVSRPALTSFLVAFVVRFVAAAAINLLHNGVLIPDEGQYLILALFASEGELTPGFWSGYGQALFDSTRAFMWPLTALFWLFGPSRFIAQLVPVLFGAVTAAATTVVARRFLRPEYALIAGLIVALFPSQVLWSSVVLRESLIWAGLAGIAVAAGYSQRQLSGVRIVWSAVTAGVLFVAIVWLRDHTAFLALWCLFPALLIGPNRRLVRAVSAVGVLVLAPWLVGMGPAGVTFAEDALTRLGSTRCYLSMTADSSFGDCQDEMMLSDCSIRVEEETGEWHDISRAAGRLLEHQSGDWVCIPGYSGGAWLIDNTLGTSLGVLPRGLFNTMIRPLPWEVQSSNSDQFFAGLESVLWVTLYTLSGLYLWRLRGRIWQLAFPVMLVAAISLSGALTHGNLGTAFRHRGQVLFALAMLASGGLQSLTAGCEGRPDSCEALKSVGESAEEN